MENFLRPYVERTPHTWVQQLPLAEFAANNAISVVSTSFSPFYLNAGIHCCALCPGVIEWHNYGTVLGALESGLGIGWNKYLHSVTFYWEWGPS